MNWFQHDADSTQDAKIKKLLIRHGAIGYAVYFHCLELIIGDVCETNITFELEHDSEIIADNLKISGTGDKSGRDIVEDIMRTIVDLGLFTNENGHIFCYKLLKRINMSMTSNKGLREAITSAKELNHDEIMTRHDKVMTHHATYLPTNQPTIPTNKETPDKPDTFSKPTQEKAEDERFQIFYESYPKKTDKTDARKVFKSLMKEGVLLDTILSKLKIYQTRIERERIEAKYIRGPARFLRTLEDFEIPKQTEKPKTVSLCPKCGVELRNLACPQCFTNYDLEGNEL